MVVPALKETLDTIRLPRRPEKLLAAADLGCSCGQNTLVVADAIVQHMTDMYVSQGHDPPEFCIYFSDLPSNDFNTLFRLLPNYSAAAGNGSRRRRARVVPRPPVPGEVHPRVHLHLLGALALPGPGRSAGQGVPGVQRREGVRARRVGGDGRSVPAAVPVRPGALPSLPRRRAEARRRHVPALPRPAVLRRPHRPRPREAPVRDALRGLVGRPRPGGELWTRVVCCKATSSYR